MKIPHNTNTGILTGRRKMNGKLFCNLFVLSLVLLFCSAGDFLCPFKFASKTAALAKKKGIFVCSLSMSPSEFYWNGHRFKAHEAWLEQRPKGDRVFYCFTLEVDSKFPDEFGGEAIFRPSDGVFWHHRFPVHCIEAPVEQKQLDLYLLDINSPHTGPALPGEQKILLRRVDAAAEERAPASPEDKK